MHASYLQVVFLDALEEVAKVRRDELCEPGAWRVHGSKRLRVACGGWWDDGVFERRVGVLLVETIKDKCQVREMQRLPVVVLRVLGS